MIKNREKSYALIFATTLANFVGSVLSHSLNRAYLALCLRHPAQIPHFARTSDTRKTLYAIAPDKQLPSMVTKQWKKKKCTAEYFVNE
jgi:hypothetical protein